MKIMVVAAHPDDEVLGCGGSMAVWVQEGHEVHSIILAEGATSRDKTRNRENRSEELTMLQQCAQAAGEILGVASVKLLALPDNRMDSLDRLDVIKTVEQEIKRIKPDMVVTHHAGDVNIDHQITHEAVVTACRPQPGHCVRRLQSFEVPSSTEWQPPGSAPSFQPTCYVDISQTLELKIKALEAYASEMRQWPHSRSLQAAEHLARWRGASVGCEAADAFQLMREII